MGAEIQERQVKEGDDDRRGTWRGFTTSSSSLWMLPKAARATERADMGDGRDTKNGEEI
jgi:hypothetical protein